jgi:LacI family transcriptional regulator
MGVTMKNIADNLNISINAVSIALNNKAGVSDEMRAKILRTAEKMGYLEKRNKFIRTFSNTNLCIMMQKIYSDDMNFYSKVLYSFVEEAKKSGYDTIMNFFDDEAMGIPSCVERYRVSGIVIIGKISDHNIAKLKEYHIPLVLVDHASLMYTVDSVITDNKLGGFIITKYLLDKGYRRIGFFGDLNYSLSIKERFFGFKEALMCYESDLEFENLDEYVKKYSILSNIEQAVLKNDTQKIVQLVKMARNLPQAFVCSNDRAAIALLMALQILNMNVPDDISLVGFDNIDMCEKVNPKLTTVNVDKEALGKRAVNRLKYQMTHADAESENTVISVKLIERESVKR